MSLRNKNKLYFVSVCLVISLELVCYALLSIFIEKAQYKY